MRTREKYLNSQLDHLVQQHRAKQAELADIAARFKTASEHRDQLSNDLAQLTDDLETIKVPCSLLHFVCCSV